MNLFTRIYLTSSDPVSLRYVIMPGHFTRDEMLQTAAILFGLDPEELDFEINALSELPDSQDLPIRTVFSPGDRISVYLRRQKSPQADSALILNMEFMEPPAQAADKAMSELTLPLTIAAFGFNVPKPVWVISEINRIHHALLEAENIKYGADLFFRREDLLFLPGKCENTLRKRFAPETARKEANRALAIPLMQLLEKQTVPCLKAIMDERCLYYDSTSRKPDLIYGILENTDKQSLLDLLENVSLREYKHLHALLMDGIPTSEIANPEKLFPLLSSNGVAAVIGKGQLRVATELMDLFEKNISEGREESFLERKYLETTLRACGALYTCFDLNMFLRMLTVIAPAADQKNAALWLAKHGTGNHGFCRMACKNSGIWYRSDHLDQTQLMGVWAKNRHTADTVYLPDREEALRLAEEDSCRPDTPPFIELYAYLVKSNCYYWLNMSEHYEEVVREIRACRPESQVLKTMSTSMNYQTRTNPPEEMKEVLRKASRETPRAVLGGYTVLNCPPAVREYAAEVKQRQEEKKEQRINSVSTVKKGGKRK